MRRAGVSERGSLRCRRCNGNSQSARLISRQAVSSQPQLVDLLASDGIAATQATVSRDLDDLGAVKVRVPGGETVYAIPEYEPSRLAPQDQLRRVMGEWVAEVKRSGDIVVLRTPPGCAHVVASALDRSGIEGIIGHGGWRRYVAVRGRGEDGRQVRLESTLRELGRPVVTAPGERDSW